MRLPRPIEMAVPVVCAFLLGAVAMLYPLGSSAAEGLKLPPAEYKPLPVGTKVDYREISFIVQRVDGFDTVFKVSSSPWAGHKQRWYGGPVKIQYRVIGFLHSYALFGRSGTLAYSGLDEWTAELTEKARKALEAMWPLEVGKKAAFEVGEKFTGDEPAWRTWNIRIEVEKTGVVTVGEQRYPVFIVKEKGISPSTTSFNNNALDYLAEYKYNPDSGLVLEYYRIWNSEERPGEYELRTRDFANAKYGDGAGDLQLVALPPLETRVTVDTARLKSEAEARFKAEIARINREAKETLKVREAEAAKARKAEIARIKREAEETLKVREAEAAKAQKAEIARIKREAEEARKVREGEAAKAQDAEYARIKREAEEASKAEIVRIKRKAEEARKAGSAGVDKARAAEIARLEKEVEQRHWGSVRDSQDLASVEDYLKQYPKGRFTQEAKARIAVLQRLASASKIDFGNYHALVIGIDEYKYLPKLQMAVNDAKAVARILKDSYGFKVTLLLNANHGEIIDAFDEFQETLTDKDNLLIYYAGHGWLNEEVDRGYWLPANAKPKRRRSWVSNVTITDTLKGLSAKHVMVVADSCYSGTLVRAANAGDRKRTGDYWKEMASKWARVAITSGGLEPVADKGGGDNSPFAKAFLDTLGDNKAVMDGTTLFSKMRRPVMVNAEQTPQYSDVRNAGHDGGDFLFVRKK